MTPKVKAVLQVLVQILAQGAVAAIIPAPAAPYVAAVIAAIGVLIAFNDPSVGMAKAESNMKTFGSIHGDK